MKTIITLFILSCFISLDAQTTFGTQQVITTSANYVVSIHATDLDGDGDTDVLSASPDDSKIAWYENVGSGNGIGGGTFGPQQVITTNAGGASSVYATDLDGDGDADVLSTSWHGGEPIAWYENVGSGNGSGGGTFGPQQVIASQDAGEVYATDLDGDGDADVLSASWDKIAWYENLGAGTFGPQEIITTNASYTKSIHATDLDGDGDADVLSASAGDDKIAWYENLGLNSGTFGTQQIITTSTNWANGVYATDLDGDGDADVLSTSYSDDKIAWYENTGLNSGIFGPQQLITTNANGATSVYAADLDGDGDADVVSSCSNYNDNKIAWFENIGSGNGVGGGSFGAEQVITTNVNGADSVYAADLDGDGDADVLSANNLDNQVTWYENLSTYWRVSMTETPSYELNFNFSHGQPTAQYFAFYTLNTLNGSSPNTGGFFGLHVHMSTIWDQLSLAQSGDPIFGGILNASGTSTAIYNQIGLGSLSGLTVWAVAIQQVQGQFGTFEASPITAFTFL